MEDLQGRMANLEVAAQAPAPVPQRRLERIVLIKKPKRRVSVWRVMQQGMPKLRRGQYLAMQVCRASNEV